MGRIYQTLAQGRAPIAEPELTRLKVVEDVPCEDDVPFIEVGGPEPIGSVFGRPSVPSLKSAPRLRKGVFSISFRPVASTQPLAPVSERLSDGLIAYHDPAHEVAAQYRGLSREILGQLSGLSSRAIAIGSAISGSGATTVALNLGLTLAQDRQRVVVVDANWNRPAIAASLGIASEPGLLDVLANAVPLAWTLHPTGVDGLTALPLGKGGLVTQSGFASAVIQLRRRFDWVIIDGLEFVDEMDATYLVVRQDDLNAPEVSDVHEKVLAAGGQLRGYILSQ